jgi:hypothetical protein
MRFGVLLFADLARPIPPALQHGFFADGDAHDVAIEDYRSVSGGQRRTLPPAFRCIERRRAASAGEAPADEEK